MAARLGRESLLMASEEWQREREVQLCAPGGGGDKGLRKVVDGAYQGRLAPGPVTPICYLASVPVGVLDCVVQVHLTLPPAGE
eukprot:16432986-Heterocapsa_arctica.AAC.1